MIAMYQDINNMYDYLIDNSTTCIVSYEVALYESYLAREKQITFTQCMQAIGYE